jgi:hypothetical protein
MRGRLSLRKRTGKRTTPYLYSDREIVIAIGIVVLAYRLVIGEWPDLKDVSDEAVRLALTTRYTGHDIGQNLTTHLAA